MPTFSYVARDAQGNVQRGKSEAESQQVLIKRLQQSGNFVTSVVQEKGAAAQQKAQGAKAKKKGEGFLTKFQKVKLNSLSVFCRQFATMINAGVSLVRCLAVLEQQTQNARLRGIIRELSANVEAGETLSKSLQKWPTIFNQLFIGLVRAGEVGGVLDETLDRLAGFLESDVELRRKVKSAMTYPTLVLVAAVGILTFLVTFILPKFMEIFKDFKVEMPALTQALMDISNFCLQKWYIAIGGCIAFSISFKLFKRTKFGKRTYDWAKMKVPIFGSLSHKIALARSCRTLATLMGSGVPILQAMETTAGAVDNEIFTEVLMKSRAAVREGERIGEPLERSGLFPPMVVHMITIGEETGSLDMMLSKVADFYEKEVEAQLAGLAAAIEPIMIIGLGLMVGTIVIAMFLPLLQIITNLTNE